MTTRPLTAMQERFVEEYLVDLNATGAARRAGYATPGYGRQLLSLPHVAAAIQKAKAERSARVQIEADTVLRELARLALSSLRDVVEWDDDGTRLIPSEELSEDAAAAVREITIETRRRKLDDGEEIVTRRKAKMHDKRGALRDAMQHLGLLHERSTALNLTPEDLEGMTTTQLERIRRGEDPLTVLAGESGR